MFCHSTAWVERDSFTVSAMRRRSSFITTTSAASIAVSVPARAHLPPMSACARKGRVVDAVPGHRGWSRSRCNVLIASSLCSGNKSPRACDAGLQRDSRGGGLVVAGQHDRGDAQRLERPRRPRARRA